MTEPSESLGDGPGPTPRWVKVLGSIFAAVVLAIVIVHLAGGGLGNHGP